MLARIVAQAGGKLFAVDRDGVSSLNLTVDKAKEKTLDEVLAAIKPALTDSRRHRAGRREPQPAGRARHPAPVQAAGGRPTSGPVTRDEVQYYLLKDGKAYILTVVSGDPALAATIAETLRIR